ncbi:hypothetical protein ACNR9Q_15105 [Maribacter sp. X9]|uniref:hypothetical protein n=1 Tax=Maribacter sp. X9 TaxID=3402159 RepID=UPI003AF37774
MSNGKYRNRKKAQGNGDRSGSPKKYIAPAAAGPSLKRYAIPFPNAPSSPKATGKIQVYKTPQVKISCWEDVQNVQGK